MLQSLPYKIFLLTALMWRCTLATVADTLPHEDGERTRYGVQIDIRNAYISGICCMLYEDGKLKSSIINEFGFTTMDFEYDKIKDKVKIITVPKPLNRWYIKRTLRRDLKELLKNIEKGNNSYEDTRHHITFTFNSL